MTHEKSQRRRLRMDLGPGPFLPDHVQDDGVYSPDGRLCCSHLKFYTLTPGGRTRSRNWFEAWDDLLPVGGSFATVSTDFALSQAVRALAVAEKGGAT